MTGRRYKHVASRFKQWRILPADCKSWLERRGDDAASGAEADAAASGPTAGASAAATVTGRMNSELPENVTAERLYQSRLYNLALERHKMIQESDYVRNQFIDHQVRKARSKSLSRLLQGMDIEQYRIKSASGVEKFHQRSAHARLMILATKVLGLSIDEISKLSEEELRLRLNISSTTPETDAEAAEAPSSVPALTLALNHTPLRSSISRASVRFLNTGQTDPFGQASSPMATRRGSVRPNSTASSSLLPQVGSSGAGDRSYRRLSKGVAAANPFRPSSSVRVVVAPTLASATSQPDRRPRTASARRRVQSDPRCVQLINSLTPRYKPTSKTPDVGAIIRANPSLFQPAQASTDAMDELQLRRQQQQQRQKAAKVRRTRREALEVLDSIARTRYYEAGNLATLC